MDLIPLEGLSDQDLDLLSPQPLQAVLAASAGRPPKPTTTAAPASSSQPRSLLDAFEEGAQEEQDFLM